MESESQPGSSRQDGEHSRSTLVVLLHAFGKTPASLDDLVELLQRQPQYRDAEFFVPPLPLGYASLSDPVAIANEIVTGIDRQWVASNGEIERIVLIGHSYGALLARKVYVVACGETPKAPFDPTIMHRTGRPWAAKVERLVLLAGMNRGWRISHHLSLFKAIYWTIGTWVGALLWLIKRRPPAIFCIRRGASFITQLRVQWLWMRRFARERGYGDALTIQLLGSIDDIVAPEDNVDLVSGRDFVYLDVPHSGHGNVIRVADPEPLATPTAAGACTRGQARASQILKALLAPVEALKAESVLPHDHAPADSDETVRDVVFVIHGIRDRGYWTHKIARRVQSLAQQRGGAGLRIATATSSYGYFPMLPFLMLHKRREKVEWLMDQYTEALARWPNARFSFIGHSNGTYLLARALRDYPSCRFHNVVFAGSVVPTHYPWGEAIERGQVQRVLNYVATSDWVVAIFPKALEMVEWQDLGSAGHDGFREPRTPAVAQVHYVRGAHSAALSEDNWDALASFILDGKPLPPPEALQAKKQSLVVGLAGSVAPLVCLALIGLALLAGIGIWQWEPDYPPVNISTLATLAFVAAIWHVVTRL
ncbi:esterase/lipase family protein [Alkalilimnicola ehrlichii MLHE-1]|uniref:Uncharacterized protein n=1 Tax=Alkalilimnicola ehrlichii (strain ATCC BAA-1101 / DSM 17681 / MLHE-1) TaxID=187272 RepID=Q0A7S8_ALKEH|nr:hypothetical protein [Alkalilimnicola ehrlichii]ABI57109.1 hypothetical protein Mlg_1763 [Alkalilimnicola ehrlichii MLHE-1]